MKLDRVSVEDWVVSDRTYLSVKLTSSIGSSSKSAGNFPETSSPAPDSSSWEVFSKASGFAIDFLPSLVLVLFDMTLSGITPFCIVLARVLLVVRSGLAGSSLEKDLETCIGRGRWLSFFRPFKDAMKCGNSSNIVSVIACKFARKEKELRGELPWIGG